MLNVTFWGPLLILKHNLTMWLQVSIVICFLHYVTFRSVNITIFPIFQSIVGSNFLLLLTILLCTFLYIFPNTNVQEFLSYMYLGTELLGLRLCSTLQGKKTNCLPIYTPTSHA